MKKILFLGNSQVACIKEAYENSFASQTDFLKNFIFHFWAINGGGGPKISIEKSKLLHHEAAFTNINIKSSFIDLNEYDSIVLTGVGVPAIRKRHPSSAHHTFHTKFEPANFVSYKDALIRGTDLISSHMYTMLISSSLERYPCFENICKIGKIFKGKLCVLPFPLPVNKVIQQDDFDLKHMNEKCFDYLAWYYTQQLSKIIEECDIFGASCFIPPDSWLKSGTTPEIYQDSDAWHHNAKFGNLQLEWVINNI